MTDVLERYRPPFDLTADMLFVVALAPTAPLRQVFPGVPFLSAFGKTPLLIWFSRIKEACYGLAEGGRRCEREGEAVPYDELNVVAILREAAFFVPGIYATGAVSVQLGRAYGMPKGPIEMELQADERCFASSAADGTRRSFVRARLLGPGRAIGKLLVPMWPRRIWPVRFPSGSAVRGTILSVPRVQLAQVQEGWLALEAAWLPGPVRWLPFGVYMPDLRMRLPPP